MQRQHETSWYEFASKQWGVEASACAVHDGKAIHAASKRSLSYADLSKDEEAAKLLDQAIPSDVSLTQVKEWKVLGTPVLRPNGRGIVSGEHRFPSDVGRTGMLYGKVLRAASYGAKLVSVDLAPAKAMKDVVAVQDEQFVGVAAPTSFRADQALEAISKTAKWDAPPHPSSAELYDYLKQHTQNGIPPNPFTEELAQAKQVLSQTYHVLPTPSTRRWNPAQPWPNGPKAS